MSCNICHGKGTVVNNKRILDCPNCNGDLHVMENELISNIDTGKVWTIDSIYSDVVEVHNPFNPAETMQIQMPMILGQEYSK